ncbi:heme biosynthesis HemY N-terminal domain-containing protein, partial [Methylobacterium trifolii]
MWRALAFLALLAVAAFGAVWIADRPGTVTIVWNGYEVATSLAIALVGVFIAAIVIGLIWAVVRGVIELPEILVRGSKERRRAKGFTALSRGMVAVGSGDPLAARRHAGDAERLLGAEPLTLLLKAQAAQISGDRQAAENAFQRMVDDPETRVLGLRGLFVEARRREDEFAAREYASEAARLAPSVTWANEAVLEAQCADGDWGYALEIVESRSTLGLIDKSAARRQRAVLLTAAAQTREAG